jgi:hypothetical protein
VEEGSRETDGGREDQLMPNGNKCHRTEANYIQSNAEAEGKPVVVVVLRGGEAIRQKEQLGGRAAGSTFIGRPSEH